MRTSSWIVGIVGSSTILFGGPALIRYVTPTEEELRKKYNPELRARAEANQDEKLKEAEEFITKLKQYSNDHRPIWTVWKEDAMRQKKAAKKAEQEKISEKKTIADEIRRQRLEGTDE